MVKLRVPSEIEICFMIDEIYLNKGIPEVLQEELIKNVLIEASKRKMVVTRENVMECMYKMLAGAIIFYPKKGYFKKV